MTVPLAGWPPRLRQQICSTDAVAVDVDDVRYVAEVQRFLRTELQVETQTDFSGPVFGDTRLLTSSIDSSFIIIIHS